ncbi:hypothetical protein BACCAP_02666 [Pseudoflavonifractor capillosus ATCC 29799]|uniref:Uncharacterized protein n=1 Tax=Pseudoflavonifractor capillosus ATCC 29799 TaxID=411467 RepID=A6NWS2_9FIRM|nr:hypothetical protein BACCAP_02666 [Pseudoflavonifractor capillosus ATCC 29799]
MKMGKHSNVVGLIESDHVIRLFGMPPPVYRAQYTSGSPPHF